MELMRISWSTVSKAAVKSKSTSSRQSQNQLLKICRYKPQKNGLYTVVLNNMSIQTWKFVLKQQLFSPLFSE